jgi:hypothetical protein
VYEQQVPADLAAFQLPDEWKQTVIELNRPDETRGDDVETQRQQLTARLARLKDLYAWGDLTREQYQVERDRIERTLAQLQPVERPTDQLDALATYVQSLPAAWADADQRQRNEMAMLLYEEVWVDGPRVEYVKPRRQLESLFQTRTGAAQPTKVSIQGGEFSSGDPDGIRTHDLHRDRVA